MCVYSVDGLAQKYIVHHECLRRVISLNGRRACNQGQCIIHIYVHVDHSVIYQMSYPQIAER